MCWEVQSGIARSEVAWRGAAGSWATEGGYVGAVGGRYGWGRVAGCIRVAVGGIVVRGVVHDTLEEDHVVSGGGWGQLWRAAGNWGRLMAWARARWAAC